MLKVLWQQLAREVQQALVIGRCNFERFDAPHPILESYDEVTLHDGSHDRFACASSPR